MRDTLLAAPQELTELERLANCVASVVGKDLNSFHVAAPFSVLPIEEALMALQILVLEAVNPASLSEAEKEYLAKSGFRVLNVIHDGKFLERFLAKNKGLMSGEYWRDFRDGFKHVEFCVWPQSELKRFWLAFDALGLTSITGWRVPSCSDEVPVGFSYPLPSDESRDIQVSKIDIILEAEDVGLFCVKCPESNQALILKKICSNKAAVIGENPFAVELLGKLKRERVIPRQTDTWEWSVAQFFRYTWQAFDIGIRPNSEWTCACCGDLNSPETKEFLLSANYDFSGVWGECQLLTCSVCGRISIVLIRHCRRLADGGNELHFDKPVTIGAAPSLAALKAEILRTGRKPFGLSNEKLAGW